MFLRTDIDLPKDLIFKAKLTKLGFQVNNQGQFVTLPEGQDPDKLQTLDQQQPEFFRYHHTDSERDNDRRDEAFRTCAREEVLSKLTSLGLKKIYLTGHDGTRFAFKKPLDPHVTILISDLVDLKSQKDVVVINGENNQDLAIWAWRHLRREGGIRGGSAVGLMTKLGYGDVSFEGEAITEDDLLSNAAMEELKQLKLAHANPQRKKSNVVGTGYVKKEIGIIILNPGQLLYSPSENRNMSNYSWLARKTQNALTEPYMVVDAFNRVPGHRTPADHINTVLKNIIPALVGDRAHLHFIALGDGAGSLLARLNATLMANPNAHIGGHLGQMALVQSTHTHEDLRSAKLLDVLKRNARGWVTSPKPTGTLLQLPYGMESPTFNRRLVFHPRRATMGEDRVYLPGPSLPHPAASIPDHHPKGLAERLRLSDAKLAITRDSSDSFLASTGRNTPAVLGNVPSAQVSDHMFPLEVDRETPIESRSQIATARPLAQESLRVAEDARGNPTAREAGHPDYTIPRVRITVPVAGQSPHGAAQEQVSNDIDAWLENAANAGPAEDGHLGTHTPEPRLGTPESGESTASPLDPEVLAAVESMVGRLQEQFDYRPELPHLEENRSTSTRQDTSTVTATSPDAALPSSSLYRMPEVEDVPESVGNPDVVGPSAPTLPLDSPEVETQSEDRPPAISDLGAVTSPETAAASSVTTPPPVNVVDNVAVYDAASAVGPGTTAEAEATDPMAHSDSRNATDATFRKQSTPAKIGDEPGQTSNVGSAAPAQSVITAELEKLEAAGVWTRRTPLPPTAADEKAARSQVKGNDESKNKGRKKIDPWIENLKKTVEKKTKEKVEEKSKEKGEEKSKEKVEKSEEKNRERNNDGNNDKDEEKNNLQDEDDAEAPKPDPVSYATYSGGVEVHSEMLFPTAINNILAFVFPPNLTHSDEAIARHRALSSPLPRSESGEDKARDLALKGTMPVNITTKEGSRAHAIQLRQRLQGLVELPLSESVEYGWSTSGDWVLE